jgi:acetylornithine deacetylase
MWESIDRVIASRRDAMVSLLAELVRSPSVRYQEGPAQMIMAREFRRLGAELDVFEPKVEEIQHLPGYSPVETGYEGRPNVVGVIKGAGGGRSLVMNGHIDVVSAEPVENWTVNPWGGEVKEGRLYGRASCDMKSGLVAMVWAVDALRRSGIQLVGDLTLESVIEEECTGNGTLACRARGYLADAAVVCEPSGLTGALTSMGVQWARVKIKGSSSHAAWSDLGANAIEKAYVVIAALKELERRRNARGHELYRGMARPVFCNPGVIKGGDWPSTVAGNCTLEVRMGVLPGQTMAEARREFEDILHETVEQQKDAWLLKHPPVVEWVGFQAEGCVFDTSSEYARVLEASHRAVVGTPLKYKVSTGCNDMRFFSLYHGIPATMYGPAGTGAHSADESVDLASIETAARVYTRFIVDWCGVA